MRKCKGQDNLLMELEDDDPIVADGDGDIAAQRAKAGRPRLQSGKCFGQPIVDSVRDFVHSRARDSRRTQIAIRRRCLCVTLAKDCGCCHCWIHSPLLQGWDRESSRTSAEGFSNDNQKVPHPGPCGSDSSRGQGVARASCYTLLCLSTTSNSGVHQDAGGGPKSSPDCGKSSCNDFRGRAGGQNNSFDFA